MGSLQDKVEIGWTKLINSRTGRRENDNIDRYFGEEI